MPEQEDLLRKAADSVEAARLLGQGGFVDFAAARAYYAMFYVAEAFLLDKGLAFSKHGAVHAAFNEHFCKPGLVPPHFFRYLTKGMELRHAGDYRRAPAVTAEQMREQIAHAGEFLDLATRLLGPILPEP